MTLSSPFKQDPLPDAKEPGRVDAIIVGASIAGCVLALSLARKNWRVAVIEKREDPQFYKKICTHIIHPGGVDQLRKLGIGTGLSRSAQATAMKLMHDSQHAFFPFGGKHTAANIERTDIDPALKQRLSDHPHINLYQGYHLKQLLRQGKQIIGAQCLGSNKQFTLYANLVIAADGRHSQTARMAGGKEYTQENHRVAMFCYFEHTNRSTPLDDRQEDGVDSLIWAINQGDEYIGYFPNRHRVLVSWYLPEETFRQLPRPKEAAFEQVTRFLAQQGLMLGRPAERVVIAKQTSPLRNACRAGHFAMVGDARLAADPLTGVGCSWAISSARMLARCLPDLGRKKPGSIPSESATLSRSKAYKIRAGLRLYNLLHTLKYRLPSYCMTFMSMHGKWIYRRPVFDLATRLSARRASPASGKPPQG